MTPHPTRSPASRPAAMSTTPSTPSTPRSSSCAPAASRATPTWRSSTCRTPSIRSPSPGSSGAWRRTRGQMIESAINQGMATYNLDMPPCIHFKTTDTYLTEYPVYYRDGLEERIAGAERLVAQRHPHDPGHRHEVPAGRHRRRAPLQRGRAPSRSGRAAPTWFTIYGSDYIDQLAESGFAGEARHLRPLDQGVRPGRLSQRQAHPADLRGARDRHLQGLRLQGGTPWRSWPNSSRSRSRTSSPRSSAIRASARAGEDTEFGRDPETLVSNINYGPYYAIKCKPVPYATLAALDVDGEINVLLPDGTKVGRPVRLRQRLGAA